MYFHPSLTWFVVPQCIYFTLPVLNFPTLEVLGHESSGVVSKGIILVIE